MKRIKVGKSFDPKKWFNKVKKNLPDLIMSEYLMDEDAGGETLEDWGLPNSDMPPWDRNPEQAEEWRRAVYAEIEKRLRLAFR